MEKPWLNARKGAEPGENCDNVITKAALLEYYSSLSPDGEPI